MLHNQTVEYNHIIHGGSKSCKEQFLLGIFSYPFFLFRLFGVYFVQDVNSYYNIALLKQPFVYLLVTAFPLFLGIFSSIYIDAEPCGEEGLPANIN